MTRIWFDTEFQDNGRTIELISLGAVREDGARFYAEAAWTDLDRSSDWVKANVHPHLRGGLYRHDRRPIAADFEHFCRGATEFWADSPAYDWVAVSQLYGTMLDRPDGWPYSAFDLRQLSAQARVPVGGWPAQEANEHDALADAFHHKAIWEHITRTMPKARYGAFD